MVQTDAAKPHIEAPAAQFGIHNFEHGAVYDAKERVFKRVGGLITVDDNPGVLARIHRKAAELIITFVRLHKIVCCCFSTTPCQEFAHLHVTGRSYEHKVPMEADTAQQYFGSFTEEAYGVWAATVYSKLRVPLASLTFPVTPVHPVCMWSHLCMMLLAISLTSI